MNSTARVQMENSDLNPPAINTSPALWNYIDGGHGEYFSMSGSFIAGAQGDRLTVWKDGKIMTEVFSSWPCEGYPVWKENEIFWNDIMLNNETGASTRIGNLNADEGFRPKSCQWSVDGDFCVITFENTKTNKQPASKTVVIHNNGVLKHVLEESGDYAPKAICINKNHIVVGSRTPVVYDFSGNKIATLDNGLFAQRLMFSKNNALLFIQTFESISLWETENWTSIKTIKGPWLNGSICAKDDTIYAIDFASRLFLIRNCLSTADLLEIPVPAPISTIDVGTKIIMASFAQGTPLAWAFRKEIEG